jgi:hypothetical protein
MRYCTREAYEGDIVSRLRNWRGLHLASSGDLFEEAADEIERLRLSQRADFPEPENSAIEENTQQAAMVIPDRVLVDPPQGWRYGFPKVWDRRENPDCREWLVENGYPRTLADEGLPCTFTEVSGDDDL